MNLARVARGAISNARTIGEFLVPYAFMFMALVVVVLLLGGALSLFGRLW